MFDQEVLAKWLSLIVPSTHDYVIAYSGGLDSHVLLHAMAGLREKFPNFLLHALHINHGISHHAEQWEQHCQTVCAELKVPLKIKRLHVTNRKNLEAELRRLRYAIFSEELQANQCLLLAHHKNDQAETLLLQLLRGAGPSGLAAMAYYTAFAQGTLARPLLNYHRAAFWDYANRHHLRWVEDESNDSLAFDRNYLRHKILPLIEQRWTNGVTAIARSARHCATADRLIKTHLQTKWRCVFDEEKKTLRIADLLNCETDQQGYLIREWLQRFNISMPSEIKLRQIQQEVLLARQDAAPQVKLHNIFVRRYQGHLYAVSESLQNPPTHWQAVWNLQKPLRLPENLGTLQSQLSCGQNLLSKKVDTVSVGFRQGGERCRPLGRGGSHPLKKLFQEWQVLPWQRQRIPLIYVRGELAAVVGFCVCEGFHTTDVLEEGYELCLSYSKKT